MLKKTFLITLCIAVLFSTMTLIKIGNQEQEVFNIPINHPIQISHKEEVQVEKPIGTIKIPKIELEKPLYEKDSKKNNIEENVTILKESKEPSEENSIVWIAAHSGTSSVSFFNRLDELEVGNEVTLEYKNHLYTYTIIQIQEQTKDGYIRGRRENKRQLVLTTCCPNKENCQLIINCIEKES